MSKIHFITLIFRLHIGGFVYVVSGEIQVSNVKVKPGKAYFFEQGTRGLDLRGEKNTLVMTASGIPHRQPIYQHGPYVD